MGQLQQLASYFLVQHFVVVVVVLLQGRLQGVEVACEDHATVVQDAHFVRLGLGCRVIKGY